MKYYLAMLLTCCSMIAAAQSDAGKRKFGLKVGANFSTIHFKEPTEMKLRSRQGMMVAGFFSPSTRGVLGYKSEIVYSRQGFTSITDNIKTIVTNDYLLLPQFTTINISRFLQLQLGGQIGYLIKAEGKTLLQDFNMTEITNRIDYGAAGGIEIYPFKGLIIGGRYSMSFGNVYKPSAVEPWPDEPGAGRYELKSKSGVVSLFMGYRF